ncbi:hypothetical protein HY251_12165, partial [bacterium]|nr:hypothetical protein [bacterium]
EELGLDAAPPVVRPRKPIDPPLPVAQDVVLVINDELKHELRKAQSLPDLERKQREREVNSMFAAVFLRKGLSTTDRVLAKAELGRVLDLADPTSPAAFEARKRLEALKASEGN